MGAASSATTAPDRAFDMDAAVIRLMALAANKRAARSLPERNVGDDADLGIGAHLFRIGDFPEPSPEWRLADGALKDFARDLGGVEQMVDVYDEVVERHGYHAAAGVSASWDGCLGWWH